MKQLYYHHLFLLTIVFLFIKNDLQAQKNSSSLFKQYSSLPNTYNKYLKKGSVGIFNTDMAKRLITLRQKKIELSFTFENKEWIIELETAQILAPHFKVITGTQPTEKYNYENEILHYKGHVKGKQHTLAALSILGNKVMAVIGDDKGNINIGAINTTQAVANNEHIIYREADLIEQNTFECQPLVAPNTNPIPTYNAPESTNATTINAEPVDVYFEADYTIFLNNGSNITNVVNYVTALINVVHTMYENDSVNTQISGIKVWNTPDPYQALTTSSSVLNLFASNMTNGFPGDLAHFLSQRNLGGGVAYLNVLCSINYYKTAVSGNLSNSFNMLPNYSWSVMVITHELGHNIGSPHTQSCSWPGGAIDNCYTTEGGCALGPAPTNGGTVMSYCHLNIGINLANGFGPLPGARIRNSVRNSTCINPAIYFETTSSNVTEESVDITNGCLPYKLVTTKLTIPYPPSQPVDVSLIPIPSANLTIGENEDVALSINNFTLNATNLSQIISFKVYNDAEIENTETLSLNFDINANGGNAVKRTTSTTYIQNILSDDYRPDSTINTLLYLENFDEVVSGLGDWSQQIEHGALSPNRWIVSNGGGTGFATKAAYISNNNAQLAYSGATVNDSSIIRLVSPIINANGYSNLQLSFLYKCKGENLFVNGSGVGGGLTYFDYGRVLYSVDNGVTWLVVRDNISDASNRSSLTAAIPANANYATNFRLAFEWRNNSSNINQPPFLIDSIVLKGTSTSPIQSLAHPNNNSETILKPYSTIHFYNPVTKNIMASLQNNSAHNFGCTKVELIRTGITATQAWGTLASYKISSKAYKITTTHANSNAAYTLKLYYTTEEINGWLSATNNTTADINMVKSNTDVTVLPLLSNAQFSSIINTEYFGATTHNVVSATYTGLANTSTYALMKPFANTQCPTNVVQYTTSVVGTLYKWQVDTGSGFTDISNNSIYSSAASNTLLITTAPTSFFGNKYRCAITTAEGIVYSELFYLKFIMTWLGVVSTAWENPLNWSCNSLPNDKTDVIINSGANFAPEINTNTAVRSITLNNNAVVMVKTGVNFTVNH